MSDHAFATRAIHAGQEADPLTGAIIPPIYQASTHVQDSIGGFRSSTTVQGTRRAVRSRRSSPHSKAVEGRSRLPRVWRPKTHCFAAS
jgi:cystathionine gamma-synthase